MRKSDRKVKPYKGSVHKTSYGKHLCGAMKFDLSGKGRCCSNERKKIDCVSCIRLLQKKALQKAWKGINR